MRAVLALVAALAVVPALACSAPPAAPRAAPAATPAPPPVAPARAFRVERGEQLPTGPAAAGTVGDYALENGRATFVISDAPLAYGFSESGGNLLDAAPRGGPDVLGQLYLYLDDTFPRQSITREVVVTAAGGGTARAAIVARGADSANPALVIETEYSLGPDEDFLTLRTTVRNTGAEAVSAYELGDVISWGQAEHFAPGHGFTFKGRISVPWLAGVGEAVSYGYAARAGAIGGPHGSAWSDTILSAVDLPPGASATIERFFVVSPRPDVAGVLARIHALRGEATGTVRGVVREAGTNAPVAGAQVWVRRGSTSEGSPWPAPHATARTDASGAFTIDLPPDVYAIDADAPGRDGSPIVQVSTELALHGDVGRPTSPPEVTLTISPVATLAFTIRERRGPALVDSPGKVTILGAPGARDPVLGPKYRAAGAGNVVVDADGRGVIPLAPGTYDVVVSRGIEFDLHRSRVVLQPGGHVELDAVLERVVDTTGYVSADFHQHQLASPDAAVSFDDRIAANLAEGVELAVATDHNQISDLAPALARVGGAAALGTVVGLEATTETIGHFQAYPLAPAPHTPRGGAPRVDGQTPQVIFGLLRALRPEIVLQVNHPRSGKSGYFDLAGFPRAAKDPVPAGLDLGFDALEILNGKRIKDFDQLILDWFQLMARGVVVTATGGSDSHAIVGQECGYPRTYLGVGDDPRAVDDGALVDVIKRRRDVIVTNGPFLRLRVGGQSAVGQTYRLAPRQTLAVELEVLAAPWVDVTRVELWRDGQVVQTLPVPAATTPRRLATTLALKAPGAYVVVVRGDGSLAPVVPAGDAGPVTPVAVSNPIWVARP